MHLSSISIKGFKSFPERTRLEFSPGVSVIVGPNGCGKSNITDAVLWALGEQSPLTVRGQSMQDMIFAGGDGIGPSQYAEVEVVLEDDSGVLPPREPAVASSGSAASVFSETSIKRRLDRSGDGTYWLNGARCRLVDVGEVLSDANLGREMHSVISQGRVEEIVHSKPRERRLLVEEAAGLGKHRKRRRRAQLKLERTQQNLDRALDVEREAGSRLRPLQRQAQAAEIHARLEREANELRARLIGDELRSNGAELASAEREAVTAREARDAIEVELAEANRLRSEIEQRLARREQERTEVWGRLSALRAAHERLSARAESLAGRRADIAAELERNRATLGTLAKDLGPERGRMQRDPAAAGLLRIITALDVAFVALGRAREARSDRDRVAELRVVRESAERAARIARRVEELLARGRQDSLEDRAARGAELLAAVDQVLEAAADARDAAGERATALERRMLGGRFADDAAAELREYAQREAKLHARLREAAETVTRAEVRAAHLRDRSEEAAAELGRIAQRLGRELGPPRDGLSEAERVEIERKLERLGRRRQQLGPVNPLAEREYEEALAHVRELEEQREDLETALTELQELISETDRKIESAFEQTFEAARDNFEELVAHLFPGGRGRLRLVGEYGPRPVLGDATPDEDADGDAESDAEQADDDLRESDQGIEIELNPAGKAMRRLSLLSGGEKSLVALAFVFAVFLARPSPFYILDEVEAALDDANIDRFLQLVRRFSDRAQFVIVTHQKRTMDAADILYGVSMGAGGLTKVVSRRMPPRDAEAALARGDGREARAEAA